MVIEDEAPVRRTIEQIRRMSGYNVLSAEDGEAGLALCATHRGPIHLILTDFVMPKLGGLELIGMLRVRVPNAKILLMSGFSDGQLGEGSLAAVGGIETIEKPFRAAALLERVRGMLDR